MKEKTELKSSLGELSTKLKKLLDMDNAPQRVIVYSDVPLFARKSITGKVLMGALADAGYKTSSKKFKLPITGEYWLKRFRDLGIPKKN